MEGDAGNDDGRRSRRAMRPVILAVDDDPAALARTREELTRRYRSDYRIICTRRSLHALARLEELRAAGDRVAIVLAAQWLPDLSGTQLLTRVPDLHPHAKRALLISWGDWDDADTAAAIRGAMAIGCIDYYVLRPWTSPDELFHRTMCEFLLEWSRAETNAPREVTVVADPWSPRAHELRTWLARNGVPHAFCARDSEEGVQRLREADCEHSTEPVVFLLDGRVLVNPTNTELARGWGVTTDIESGSEFDVVVVGAGPAGLAAAVYASSEGLRALVVEREAIGGQAGYSARIRNYLGFARGISGAELAQRAYQQAWVFGTHFVHQREAVGLRFADGWHVLSISDGTELRSRATILATGVSYRRLGLAGLDRLIGKGVYYGSTHDAQQFRGRHVFVVGGGNSAGQAAVHLGRHAKSVTILVRGETLAATMSQYLIHEIDAAPNIQVQVRTEVVGGTGDRRLESLDLRDSAAASVTSVHADALFVHIGAHPHTDWLPEEIGRDRHGFVLTGDEAGADEAARRWPLERRPSMFETTVPGVFAVGDVRSQSVKRVAGAVGEGSVVIHQVHRYLAGDEMAAAAAPRGARIG